MCPNLQVGTNFILPTWSRVFPKINTFDQEEHYHEYVHSKANHIYDMGNKMHQSFYLILGFLFILETAGQADRAPIKWVSFHSMRWPGLDWGQWLYQKWIQVAHGPEPLAPPPRGCIRGWLETGAGAVTSTQLPWDRAQPSHPKREALEGKVSSISNFWNKNPWLQKSITRLVSIQD